MTIVTSPEGGTPTTVRLSSTALGVVRFRMRHFDQTQDEVINEVLEAMMLPRRAEKMDMECITNPWGVGPDTEGEPE